MDKLEVGMYIRTNDGTIDKVKDFIKSEKLNMIQIKDGCVIGRKTIVKSSHNIIDLIEVGDLVNGKLVIFDLKRSKEFYRSKNDFITCENYTYENDEIETILTKEQIKQNQYVVEE